ncbi:hypothetical protein V6N13_036382 [Hibiscus sabdariffa]|uniref:Uncharacterized protein n=2 Tax=Hibiscus sabdariffa TaxID=183260 RepID=A0ABR2AQS1_9ROSI
MVDSTKSRFAPYVMARLALSPSRAAALGHPIPLLSFAVDLTSRAAPSCSGSSNERSSSDSEKIGQMGGYPRLTSLSIKTPSQRRAEAPG